MRIPILLAVVTFLLSSAATAHDPPKPGMTDPGHGHGAEIGQPGDPKKISRIIQVTMNDQMRFSPASIAVRQGETIRFLVRNNGKLKHELVLGTPQELKEHAALMQKHPEMEHDDPNAVSVEPGKTGQLVWQFTKAGMVDFACLVPGHFEAGMTGQVSVRGSGHSH